MKRIVAFLAGALCLLACVMTPAQQVARDLPARVVTGTAAISGIVVTDTRPPRPARKTRVTLNSVDGAIPGRTTTTDDEGRFAFQALPQGRFNVTTTKPGYLPTTYGAKRPGRTGTPIALSDGERVNVTLTIARGGVITGAVRDSSGQPVQGAAVQVLRYGYSAVTGEKMLSDPTVGRSATTDDRGLYRAWALPPGDYVVMVTPTGGRAFLGLDDIRRLTPAEIERARQLVSAARGAGAGSAPASAAGPPLSESPVGSRATYAPVLFPGTTDLATASTITLAAGEERGNIDIQLQLIPTARLDGTINLPEGVALRSLSTTLTPVGLAAQLLGSSGRPANAIVPPGTVNTFSFAGVTPGQYTVLVKTVSTAGRRGAAGPTPAAPAPMWWGMTDVVVEGRDVSVTIDLHAGLTVSGRVAFDGASPPPSLAGTHFFLVPLGSGGSQPGPSGGDVDTKGMFTFSGVTPGRYRLSRLGSSLGSWCPKTAAADGRDVLDSPLEITNSSVKELLVTFTDQPTQVSGVLQDASGRPASDYFIIAFASDKSYWTPGSRRVVETRPANDGRYSIVGLPPGPYRIAALTDVEAGESNDPGFLSSLGQASIGVTLVEGQRLVQDLRLAGR